MSLPGLEGGGESEGAAVEDVLAALPGDQRVEGSESASLAGQGEDVGGRVFAGPVAGPQPGQPGQARRGRRRRARSAIGRAGRGQSRCSRRRWPRSRRGIRAGLGPRSRRRAGVSPPAMASAASRKVTAARSRAWPTGVNMAMLCRSMARLSACCKVSGSATSMLPGSTPSSASSGASSCSSSLAMPGLSWISGRPCGRFGAAASHVWHVVHCGQARRPGGGRDDPGSQAEPRGGSIPPQGLARPGVQLGSDRGQVIRSVGAQVAALGEVLGGAARWCSRSTDAATGWPCRRSTPAWKARR